MTVELHCVASYYNDIIFDLVVIKRCRYAELQETQVDKTELDNIRKEAECSQSESEKFKATAENLKRQNDKLENEKREVEIQFQNGRHELDESIKKEVEKMQNEVSKQLNVQKQQHEAEMTVLRKKLELEFKSKTARMVNKSDLAGALQSLVDKM
jgi:hypothetical protein